MLWSAVITTYFSFKELSVFASSRRRIHSFKWSTARKLGRKQGSFHCSVEDSTTTKGTVSVCNLCSSQVCTIPHLLFPLAPWCHLEWGNRGSFSFQTVQEKKWVGKEGRKLLWVICDKWCLPLQWWNLTSGRGFCRKNACYGERRNKHNDEILKYDASMMSDVSMMQDLVCMHSGQSCTKCF